MTKNEDLLYQLWELSNQDPNDMDSSEFDVFYEDSSGREGAASICVTKLAEKAYNRIIQLEEQLSKAIIQRDESYRQEDLLLQENKELRRKRFRGFNVEGGEDAEFWYYNLDNDNYLKSLSCPALVSADDMRFIMDVIKDLTGAVINHSSSFDDKGARGDKILDVIKNAQNIYASSNLGAPKEV